MAGSDENTTASAARRRTRRRVAAVAAVAVVAGSTVAIVHSRSSGGHRRAAPAATTTSSARPASTSTSSSTTTSSTTTSTPSSPSTTAPGTTSRALYPAHLPAGVPPATLWVYPESTTAGGYTQSYYGTANTGGQLPELVIEAEPTGMGPTTPAVLAGKNVAMWRTPTRGGEIIGVTAKVSGHDVTLISAWLTDREIGAVLDGLRTRAGAPGWDTGVLPAGLRRFGQGDRTPHPSAVFYALRFGPLDRPQMEISVSPGALMPEDTCACNPGMRRSLRTTTVNGIPAVVIDHSDVEGVPGSDFSVSWQYGTDIVVEVSVFGFDEKEALRVASSVAAADPAPWNALRCVNATHVRAACSPGEQVPATG